jgi:hypothetical protein
MIIIFQIFNYKTLLIIFKDRILNMNRILNILVETKKKEIWLLKKKIKLTCKTRESQRIKETNYQ